LIMSEAFKQFVDATIKEIAEKSYVPPEMITIIKIDPGTPRLSSKPVGKPIMTCEIDRWTTNKHR